MVESLLILLVLTEKAVVEVTILCGVNSYEVAPPLVLEHRLNDYLLLLGWQL